MMPNEQDIRNKAIGLCKYLLEFTRLRSKIVRSSDDYEEVIWLSDIPKGKQCFCLLWPGSSENGELIGVAKPRFMSPPQPSQALKPWLPEAKLGDSKPDMVELLERAQFTDPQTGVSRVELLSQHPEVTKLWEEYIEQQWWPWASEDRRLRKVQALYQQLFATYQRQQQLGEEYEVVLGAGYLVWKTPEGQEIKRHIVTLPIAVEFEAQSGRIMAGPTEEGIRLNLEQDMLDPQLWPDRTVQDDVQKKLKEITDDDTWDTQKLTDALSAWTHALSPAAQFENDLAHQTRVGQDPTVFFAPALILRKRSQRSLALVYQEIVGQLETGGEVPSGVRKLVDSGLGQGNDSEHLPQGQGAASAAGTLYFPLPANDEQKEIASRIAAHDGVVVQGPPGTGKSHTIANLVCHLLATGNRVLVTSHAGRALEVLRDKFPKDMAKLCVSLLGNDRSSLKGMEESVGEITNQYAYWNATKNAQTSRDLESELDSLRREESSVFRQLRQAREAETKRYPLSFADYQGTPQAIADRLRREEQQYAWVKTAQVSDGEPPLTPEEAQQLLERLRTISPVQEYELTLKLIDSAKLPAPDDLRQAVQKERSAQTQYERLEAQKNSAFGPALTSLDAESRSQLADAVSRLNAKVQGLSGYRAAWVSTALADVLGDQDSTWKTLSLATQKALDGLESQCTVVDSYQVIGLKGLDVAAVKSDAGELQHHLETGGKLGFWPFRPKAVKQASYLIKQVRIDGGWCSSPPAVAKLIEWVDVAMRLQSLGRAWHPYLEPADRAFGLQTAMYADQQRLLERVLDLITLRNDITRLTKGAIDWPPLRLDDPHALQDVLSSAKAVAAEKELQEARGCIARWEGVLRSVVAASGAHRVVSDLLQSLNQRDHQSYAASYDQLLRLVEAKRALALRKELMGKLASAAPMLADELVRTFQDKVWDERMVHFVASWNWARADAWLRRLSDPSNARRLQQEMDGVARRISETITKLAEAKAWKSCFQRMTPAERQALVAWQQAMKHIGKGTGKYAGRWRKIAQNNMEQCRTAIPAWVMPLYRVADSVKPTPNAFDVVIVDEASQSGPEAAFLSYIAKKIIVVGDKEQISPDPVGIDQGNVISLQQQFLKDVPFPETFGVDCSLFDLAERVYGGRIRLTEHFRCMPEIIQFSNGLFYSAQPLVPLRQYGTSRLEPVVCAVHVQGGYRDGRTGANPPEAQAIVDKIKQMIANSDYKGKTMGVISLLSTSAQDRNIANLLLMQIGPEEVTKRRLVCGNAYAFQGDERDIMLLSMVAAPNEVGGHIASLTGKRFEQIFNVAASRAKDQMWLFHSVTLEDLLNKESLRYKLLEYCLHPHVAPNSIAGFNIAELRLQAEDPNRADRRQPPPFDSWFEVDVFLRIADRGYRVIPQFAVASYHIDLVVEGMRGKLAVECDGEASHGAENYGADMARQRALERCGWRFWRVRGSSFYRDPERAMQDLWDTLARHQVYPDK